MSAAATTTRARSGPAPRAIVVGAGFAGLAAATRLRTHGFDVTVLERESAPGGRARALALAGVEADPCATLLFSSDRAIRSLLEGLGQSDELEPWAAGALCRADAEDRLHPLCLARPHVQQRPAGLQRRDALRSVRLDRLAARYADRIDLAAPERASVLDDRSAAEWARLYFGESLLRTWVAPWLAATTLGDEAEASRLLFLRHYLASRGSDPASLRAGPAALAEALARRVPTRLDVTVDSIEAVSGGGFALSARHAGEELHLTADAVVLALPPTAMLAVAPGVLVTAERDHLAAVRHRRALSAVWVTRGGVAASARRIVVSERGRALAALQFQTGGGPSRASELLVGVASGAFAQDAADLADEIVSRRLAAEAERFAPQAMREIQAVRVVRWDEGLPAFGVGHYRALDRLRRVETAQLAKGRFLTLAGDHLLGPRLEDAAASGLRAADALATALGSAMAGP